MKHAGTSVETRVQWLEFALLEQGFSPFDMRDLVVIMKASSQGDMAKLRDVVEFLWLLLDLKDYKSKDSPNLFRSIFVSYICC